ncbi:MAG: MBL fold metallo-hydrolase [Clostridiaceae bacterium]|jgi:glyoxylase-like metal-dependent hydrolase (beta-lactamase superfamily II)|nr:MBL fold metallo-hydrolase [Clostridiaceae bacterium]
MIIECISGGLVNSNVYVVAGNSGGVIIDCGCPAERIIEAVKKTGIDIKDVILTHGHFDHMYYIDSIRELAGMRIHIHKNDADFLTDPVKSGLMFLHRRGAKSINPADNLLDDGDILKIGDLELKILHTPGHTPGSICILVVNNVFTGDTLFHTSIGRTDFPGGSHKDIVKSIKNKLFTLPEDTVVYPGHGEPTDIGHEKRNNPFVLNNIN